MAPAPADAIARRRRSSVALRRAFRATHYRVETPSGPIDVRIGRKIPSRDWPACGNRGLAIVTAWNPGGRRTAPRFNRRRQCRLAAQMKRRNWRWLSAVNAPDDTRWREPAFAVLARGPRPVARLARRYGQAAIVWLPRGRPARLIWV